MPFAAEFAWGVSTSAYQIEGGATADGKVPSIWDVFCEKPGAIEDGTTGEIACDHYHRWEEDLDILADLGIPNYRLSLAWPRLLSAPGQVNSRGIDFYRNLLGGLGERGIRPWVTLYHWDSPQWFAEACDWPERESVAQFEHYAEVALDAFGDLVKHWMTFNEPWVSAFMGYAEAWMAPGESDVSRGLAAAHHQLLAHGRVVELIREYDSSARVGIPLNLSPVEPADPHDPRDVAAAQRYDGYLNRWFLDPLFAGSYPEDMLGWFGDQGPDCRAGDLDVIGTGIDFLGVNYYFRETMAYSPGAGPVAATPHIRDDGEYTTMDWEIYPQGLGQVLRRLRDEYDAPTMVITENGLADEGEEPGGRGIVEDGERIDYLRSHLLEIETAIGDGVDVSGYFVWSLLDNFEWYMGYRPRLGIVRVDYDTLARTPKASARWYADLIRSNGAGLGAQ